ncbi:DUF7882 family protein [Schumannella soli]
MNYNNQVIVDFDDRLLAHIQLAIGTKVRRGESFHFTWRDDDSVGDGRTILWITPNAPVSYKFFGGRAPTINVEWVAALLRSANSPGGMQIVPEPVAEHQVHAEELAHH